MTKNKSPERKLVSFLDQESQMMKIQEEIDLGWSVTSLYFSGKSFIGILEKTNEETMQDIVYIPPRRKIKITQSSI